MLGSAHRRAYMQAPTGFLRRAVVSAVIYLTVLHTWFLPRDAMHSAVLVVNLSVCPRPPVCHTRALCPHGSTYDHHFFTISFW